MESSRAKAPAHIRVRPRACCRGAHCIPFFKRYVSQRRVDVIMETETESYWSATSSLPEFESISRDLKVDVVVIGAGLTGITTAYLLKKEGAKVALLERGRCAG